MTTIEALTWHLVFPKEAQPTSKELAIFYGTLGYVKRNLLSELDVEGLARAMHLARRLPEMDEPYCDNPLTEMDLRSHMQWAEAILHAAAMLPPYGSSSGDE